MATITSFEEIAAWKKANALQQLIYRASENVAFKNDRRLCAQIRAASVSVMSNIAEGLERGGNREFHQFLAQAKGSVGEVKAQLHAARNCRYISQEEFVQTSQLATDSLIGGFMRYLRNSGIQGSKFK